MKKKIYNFTNIAPHYRLNLWLSLLNSVVYEYHFFYGSNLHLGIKEINLIKDISQEKQKFFHQIKNIWLKKRILIWQSKVVSTCLLKEMECAIFLGEFNVLSTWIAMLICRFRGIKVIYWTHGLYGNEGWLKRVLRVNFYKTANYLFTYENRGKQLLINQGVNENKIFPVYNSLNYDFHKTIRNKNGQFDKQSVFTDFFKKTSLPTLVFVGRLTKIKKIDLLIEAHQLIKNKGVEVNLLIIGDGDQKTWLEKKVDQAKMNDFTFFYGACYDEVLLSKLISISDLCVSPGNVGLTAIHSLSFGTPVCTHSNFFNQMPEVEAIEEGKTGCFFKEDDANDLSEKIISWISKVDNRDQIRNDCYKVIDEYYNPYSQREIIETVLNK